MHTAATILARVRAPTVGRALSAATPVDKPTTTVWSTPSPAPTSAPTTTGIHGCCCTEFSAGCMVQKSLTGIVTPCCCSPGLQLEIEGRGCMEHGDERR